MLKLSTRLNDALSRFMFLPTFTGRLKTSLFAFIKQREPYLLNREIMRVKRESHVSGEDVWLFE